MFDRSLTEFLLLAAMVSGIPLAASALIGLAVSILQSVTQVQEQSVGYLAKLVSVAIVLMLCAPFFCRRILEFCAGSLASISQIGQLR
jgi:flagellar biosynthesis protein FliQ